MYAVHKYLNIVIVILTVYHGILELNLSKNKKTIGQSADQPFHDQVCGVPSLFHIQVSR